MTEVADVTEIRGCCDGTDVAEVADVTEIRGTMAPKPYPVSKQERQYLELENWCDSTDKRLVFPFSLSFSHLIGQGSFFHSRCLCENPNQAP